MNNIIIKELVGSHIALTMEKGAILYAVLIDELNKEGISLTLDFSDMKVASPFLNASIGYLFKSFTKTEIDSRITFINLSPSTEHTLYTVLGNAEEYFKDPKEAKLTDQLVNNVIEAV